MAFYKSVFHIFLSLFLIIGFLGCETENDRQQIVLEEVVATENALQHIAELGKANLYYFGFDLRGNPQEDARQYIPLLHYLERATGLEFELRFTPKLINIIDDLGMGIIHFAAIGAGSYLLAHEKYEAVMLVRGLNSEGKASYRSCLVVSPESPIKKIEDLRNKSIVFGSKSSTQGYLIPRILLAENNLPLESLAGYRFTGSHRNCADEVIAGRVDACGMQDTMANDLSRQGLVRILYTSKDYPSSGIAVNKDVPPEVREKVKKALLDFQPNGRDAERLHNWDKTEMPNGFAASKEADFDELRRWYSKFGYLPKKD